MPAVTLMMVRKEREKGIRQVRGRSGVDLEGSLGDEARWHPGGDQSR